MRYYRLWVLSFFLKACGAAWDASYHFKYFFEEYSLPHILNFTGFVLGCVLLLKEWRRPQNLDRRSLSITTSGYILFVIAIPLDFTYHQTFGIDLTTWSPTHFLYYIGTALMIFGIWRGYAKRLEQIGEHRDDRLRTLHPFYAAFFLENLLFPCLQQENGSVAYFQYIHGHSVATKEILELLHNPYSQIYGGVPEWVYPIYTVLVVSLLTWIVSRTLKDMRIVLLGSVMYIAFRYVARLIFMLVTYPISFVPFLVILIPLLLWVLRKRPLLAALVSSTAYFLVLYGVSTSGLLIAPPVSLWMLLPVWVVALLARWVGGERR